MTRCLECDRQAISVGLCGMHYHRQWRAKNSDRVKGQAKDDWQRLRTEILAAYGNKCACCGETTKEFLVIDHVAGAGTNERKKKGPHRTLRDIKRDGFPPTYRVLCHNCNQAIAFYGPCPHAR